MKIGIISHGSPDYLIDIVTDGFIRLLGREAVSLDYTVRGGWGGQYSILFHRFHGPEPYDIHEADALVASTRSADAVQAWMKRTGKAKVAIVDGEDYHMLHDLVNHVPIYFKREYLKSMTFPPHVKPMPFGAIPEDRPAGTRVNPVFFRFHPTHVFRNEVAAVLASLGYPINPVRVEKADYNRDLVSSRIGVSVRGNGWDTYRYWEVPYFGLALLSQRMEIVIPGDFIEDQEAVFFSDIPELRRKLVAMISDQAGTAAIAAAGQQACLSRHMSIHRARTVLEAIA